MSIQEFVSEYIAEAEQDNVPWSDIKRNLYGAIQAFANYSRQRGQLAELMTEPNWLDKLILEAETKDA